MRHKPSALLPLLTLLAMLAVGFAAHAACTAGNPNANAIESTPSSDFVVNGDGTVTHVKTGLMWKQCAEGASGAGCAPGSALPIEFWDAALGAANTANSAAFAGHTDWRLPNVKELLSIIEYCGSSPAINATVFPNPDFNSFYWSSSSSLPIPSYAWGVEFLSGYTNILPKDQLSPRLVRLVRGGQSFDAFDALNPYSVIYDGNGSTGGSVPDAKGYAAAAAVTVLGNIGSLVKTGYTFSGWNTAPGGGGTGYTDGAFFTMGTANVTLYAQWTINNTPIVPLLMLLLD